MKKLLCLSVAAAMACTMTACSGSSSPSPSPSSRNQDAGNPGSQENANQEAGNQEAGNAVNQGFVLPRVVSIFFGNLSVLLSGEAGWIFYR